jgi:N-acetylneuraminate synthase/N,N'-diacetyllegionaminate synthase
MMGIQIGEHRVGVGGNTLIVAEIGVNHDGKIDRALELVQIAGECGADAVKLQIFQAEMLMHQSVSFAAYQEDSTEDDSPQEMLKRYELNDQDLSHLVDAIRGAGMLPLATPFSTRDVLRIEALALPAIKIASPDVVNWPLLRAASASGLPLLVSTGASNINEISSSIAWLRGWGATFALLHCTSCYPTPFIEANLCWISELKQRFDVPIGFSDHTTDNISGSLAVAAGACIVEKHLTYDRNAPGPDHSASADPEQFAQYVRLIRLADRMMGKPGKHVLDIEKDVRSVSRQSVVAARDLRPGQVIREEDLIVQRPGTGIPASALPFLVGKRATIMIHGGEMISWKTVCDAA